MTQALCQSTASDAKRCPSTMDLLVELSRLYKFQPATAIWRAVEIHEVLQVGLPGGTGVDLGCGDGALTGMIVKHLQQQPTLIGLDPAPEEIQIAERRGIYHRTICSGGEAIPLDDESVDFIFSNSVLEHVPDLDSTIAECSRILKPGGILIATVPAPEFREMLRARDLNGPAREEYLARMDARLAHFNYLNSEDWQTLFSANGMMLDLAKGYLNHREVRQWERLSGLTAGLLQTLGASNALLYRLQRLTRSDDKSAGGALANRAPAAWNRIWANIVAGQAFEGEDNDDAQGCLLIQATKKT